MVRIILPYCLALVFLTVAAAYPADGAAKQKSSAQIDPKAIQLLRGMSDYLGGLDQFTVHANTTMEMITPSEMGLDADRELDVWVQRPNRVRVNSSVPDHDRQFFYDGGNITIYSPKQNYYAVVPAGSTIDETIEAARNRGLELPLGDFLYDRPYDMLIKRARHGYYIGQSLVGGVKCRHLAFRGKDMDWQIWIEDSPTPFPRKIVITDRLLPAWPRYSAIFTEWNTSPTFSEDTFTFTPPSGATKIPFIPATLPTGRGRSR